MKDLGKQPVDGIMAHVECVDVELNEFTFE
jgi:hypothetical protein